MIYEKAQEAAQFIKSKFDREIQVALVLGSGLGAFADEIENAVKISYEEIPHFARSTVKGHAGRLVLGEIAGVAVAVQQGRFHYYEGYDLKDVTFPIRVFGLLGIKNLILTNAAGSIDSNFKPGSLMLIHDHLNLMGVNPLRGKNDERFGARFPDMSEVYSRKFQEIAKAAAKEMNFDLRRGVYCALSGPTYETPAEIHYLRYAGADAVGMSTVPEAIIAHHQGMKILAISCVSNYAAGISEEEINHEEVMEIGKLVAETFKNLLKRVIPKIAEEK
ncbi:MAG TPA: purine-nucleoside phosphorylase [Pyrinomonadaceae bacterium]|jgi:purine-nucleoside phosphorylase